MAPHAGEPVTVNGKQYRTVREGQASILAPYRDIPGGDGKGGYPSKKAKNNDEGDQAVFYNPIQQYNRDLSVLAILIFGEGAVAEKEARLNLKRKANVKKEKRQNKAAKSTQDVGHHVVESASGDSDIKKRKADHLEADGNVTKLDESAKRTKIQEDKTDDDHHHIEVIQLRKEDATSKEGAGSVPVPNISKSGDVQQDVLVDGSKPRQVPFTILDALSASGLRAIRYAKEIPYATDIIANDLSPEAVKSIELNIDHNDVREIVHSNIGDARAYMYSKVGNEHLTPPKGYVHRFDVIDLDPYGTAAPFLDSALQALTDGGMLCVTCTDAGVFASNGYPEKAYSLYGGITMKGAQSHEAGLRLILHAVASSAAKYSIAIEPLLSLSIDFYARLFIRVHKSQQQVKLLAGTTMMVYNCDSGCGAWTTQLVARNQGKEDRMGNPIFKHSLAQAPASDRLCDHCGYKTHLGGPMWAGPLHNPYFIQRILDRIPSVDKTVYETTDRMFGMLTTALEEDLTLATTNTDLEELSAETEQATSKTRTPAPDLKIIPRLPPSTVDNAPFFFIPNYLAKIVHCTTPPEDPLRGAIRRLGYKVTRSHCKAGSFKTNAPWPVLWEIMREWVRQKEPSRIEKMFESAENGSGRLSKGSAGYRILRRARSAKSKHACDVATDVAKTLDLGSFGGDAAELKAVLQAALYRLDYPQADTCADDADKEPNGNDGPDIARARQTIVFDAELGKEKPRGKLVRYQINPRANWGPMNRASGPV